MSASTNPLSILYSYLQVKKCQDTCLKILGDSSEVLSKVDRIKLLVAARFYLNEFEELEKRLKREPFPGYEVALGNFLKENKL